MTWWQVICAFGIPSMCLVTMIAVAKKTLASINAVKLGLQAVLRDRLYQSYNNYIDKGYAPIFARENFENMYQQYHTLGANGVMDDLRDDFLKLPTQK